MTELPATFVSAHTSALSIIWLSIVICSGSFLLAAVLGFLFRSRRCWGVAIALITADLLLGVTAALLDQLGYAH